MIKKCLLEGLGVCLCLIVTSTVLGGSNVHYARDGKTIIIDIARDSLNRLYVKGMRITKIRAVKNQLVWKKDSKKGEFYIAPFNKLSNRPINFFLQDESGNIYTVIARPKSIPSQSHQFVSRNIVNHKAKNWERSGSYPKIVAELIGYLYNHKTPSGYVSSRLGTSVLLWKETDFILVRRVIGSTFIGETYRVKNIDSKVMVLHEQEFAKNAKNRQHKVKGVAIDKHRLVPNAMTYVHIVRAK